MLLHALLRGGVLLFNQIQIHRLFQRRQIVGRQLERLVKFRTRPGIVFLLEQRGSQEQWKLRVFRIGFFQITINLNRAVQIALVLIRFRQQQPGGHDGRLLLSERFQGNNRRRNISVPDLNFGQRQNGIAILGIQGQGLIQIANGLVGFIVGQMGLGQLVKDQRNFGKHCGCSFKVSYGLGRLALLQFQAAFQHEALKILWVAA